MRKNAHVLLGTCSCFFMLAMDMVICMFYPCHMHLNPSSKSKFAQVEFFDLLLSRSLAPMSWSQILCFFLHTPLFSISVPLGLGNWTFRMYYIYIQIYIYNHIHNYHLSLSGEGLSNMSRVILPESLEDYMISYWGALQLPIAKDACYFLTNLYLCCLHQPVWISYVYCVHILCIYIIIHAKSGKPKNEAIPIQSYSWVYRYTPCLWWYKSSPILWLVTGTVYGIGFTVF